jgi:signal transduction histidine kinase
MLYEHRNKVSGAIELTYTTKVINRFQIETNEEGLRKIMEHLIQNAIKFTSKGFIEVHSELSEDQKLLLVSVKDTGVGVSSEQRKRIFEAFYKANAFQQGIGLGLAVSKKIAKKLGGDLTLDESYTDGACFVLSLPV